MPFLYRDSSFKMKMKAKRFWFYLVLFLLIFIFVSPVILTWVVNLKPVKAKVAEFVLQKTDKQLNIEDFDAQIFPWPGIRFHNIHYQPIFLEGAVSFEKLTMKLNPALLIQGKLVLDQVIIEQPKVEVELNLTSNESQDSQDIDYLRVLSINRIFSLLPEEQQNLEILVKDFATPYFRRIDGTLFLSKNQRTISIDAVVQDPVIDSKMIPGISALPIRFKQAGAKQILFSGILSSDSTLKGRCTIEKCLLKKNSASTIFSSDLIDSVFTFEPGEYKVTVKPFKVDYPRALLSVDFQSSVKNKFAFIRFMGQNVNVKQARSATLDFFYDEEVTQTLFSIVRSGHVPLINVSLENSRLVDLFDGDNLILSGSIDHGIVNIPETHLTASGVSGKVQVKKGILDIQASAGAIGQTTIASGQLSIDLLNFDDVPFQGSFSLDAFLPEIPGTLIRLLPGTLLEKELLRVKDVAGRCPAKLELILPPGAEDLVVHVATQPFSISGIYNRIPGSISLDNIIFEYNSDQIRLNQVTGVLNGCRIENIDAVVQLNQNVDIEVLSGKANINLDKAIPWLNSYPQASGIISPFVSGSGFLTIDGVQLSGPSIRPEQWRYNLHGRGSSISLFTQKGEKQIDTLSFKYQVTHQSSQLTNVFGNFYGFEWLGPENNTSVLSQLTLPVGLKNGTLQIDKESRISGQLFVAKECNIMFRLQGPSSAELSPTQIRIKDGRLSDLTIDFSSGTGFDDLDFSGKLNTVTLNKILVSHGSWAEKLKKLTQGNPMVIQVDAASQIVLKAHHLNLDSFLSELDSSVGQGNLSKKRMILFQGNRVIYKNIEFSKVAAQVELSPQKTHIRISQANLCGLTSQGDLTFKDNMLISKIPFEANDQPNVQHLLTCLLKQEDLLDGRYTLTGNLTCNSPAKTAYQHFNGDISFKAANGRIYKLTLLSRILSVLNVSKVFRGKIPDIAQTGFAYNDIIFDVDVEDSIIHLKKAVIDGQDMTLIFRGSIDPFNDSLDLDCLVAPFKTVDLIIESIPIINTLFSGRLVSVPVKITGKLSDPFVVPLHPESVGMGLLNMMTDILKAPVRLFDDFEDDDEEQKDDK